MVLRTKIRVSQSKRALTQYITIPAMMVGDSQYPFEGDEELTLELEPVHGLMIISRGERQLKVAPEGVLVMDASADLKAVVTVNQQLRDQEITEETKP